MRDAFGGTFMIQIFIVFILVYICFTALSLSYAKAYKANNAIIEYLEKQEIVDLASASDMDSLESYIEKEVHGKLNYYVENVCNGSPIVNDEAGNQIAYCSNIGIKIEQANITEENRNIAGVYYTVSTYVGWDAGFLRIFQSLGGNSNSDGIKGTWTISGQTRLIVNE